MNQELTLLNIIFLILAILGIVLAFYFFIQSRKEKVPVYNKKTTRLIRDNLSSIEKLQIYYDGEVLKNLNLTKIAFWNSGKETINKMDFVELDPLRITCDENGVIYDYKVEYADDRNVISAHKTDNQTLKITFDFLDKNQGVVLSVFHSSDSSNLNIIGSFKGSRKIAIGYGEELIYNAFFNLKFVKFSEDLINSGNGFVSFFAFMISIPIMLIGFLILSPLAYIEKLNERHYKNLPREFKL